MKRIVIVAPDHGRLADTQLSTEIDFWWGRYETALFTVGAHDRALPYKGPGMHKHVGMDFDLLKRSIRAFAPQAIHIHSLEVARCMVGVLAEMKLPFTLRPNSGDITDHVAPFSILEADFCRGVAVSANGQHVFTRAGWPAAKMVRVNPAVSVTRFTQSKHPQPGHVSLFTEASCHKNLDAFLSIAQKLKGKYTFHLVLLPGSDDLRIQGTAKSWGVADVIEPAIEHEKIPDCMAMCPIFLYTAKSWLPTSDAPVSIAEAMMCGMAVLAPAVGSISWLLNDKCGKLYKDADDAVAVLERWLVHPGAPAQIGRRARKRALLMFDHRQELSKIESLWR